MDEGIRVAALFKEIKGAPERFNERIKNELGEEWSAEIVKDTMGSSVVVKKGGFLFGVMVLDKDGLDE